MCRRVFSIWAPDVVYFRNILRLSLQPVNKSNYLLSQDQHSVNHEVASPTVIVQVLYFVYNMYMDTVHCACMHHLSNLSE